MEEIQIVLAVVTCKLLPLFDGRQYLLYGPFSLNGFLKTVHVNCISFCYKYL